MCVCGAVGRSSLGESLSLLLFDGIDRTSSSSRQSSFIFSRQTKILICYNLLLTRIKRNYLLFEQTTPILKVVL